MDNKQGNVSIHAENIMPIIKKWLYSDKDIFIREMVSNASDAITKHRLATGGEGEEYRIRVVLNEGERTISFIDNGIGMSAQEVETYINQVAFSGAEEFLKQYDETKQEDSGIIGHFGLGFYSAFMVADDVTIDTLSYAQGLPAVHWQSPDGMAFTMGPSDWAERGTKITLHLAEGEDEFLKPYRVREVLDRYCAFMAVPIYFEEEGKPAPEPEPTEEGEAPKEPEAPAPINDTHPLWLKKPSECTDEEYIEFYRKVFRQWEPPLFWVHLNVDYPFNLKGILYFPKIKQDFGGMEGEIKLFSGQVFVADNIKEVIPEFLMLLKGVIDCPDFPLNVSRSFLQNDGYVKRISAHITKKVADKLEGMFTNEREQYEKFWPDINPFIKFGCIRDAKFFERMKDCILLEKVDGGFVTLPEYERANAEKAPDKVLYTSDRHLQRALVDLYLAKGIDVVMLDSPIDMNFISFMEFGGGEPGKLKFVRVDADASDLAEGAEGEEAPDLARIEALLKQATGDDTLKVESQAFASDDVPALLVENEQSRRFRDMSRMYGGGMGFEMPSEFTVVLNRRHPLVQLLAAQPKAGREEDSQLMARQLYDLAKLSAGQMKPEEMADFVGRSQKVLTLLAEKEG